MKAYGSTVELHIKPLVLSMEEVNGILSVAVKCVDIEKNTIGENSLLSQY